MAWGPVAVWAAAALGLGFLAFFRLTVDALTCGDDGPADYGDPGARRWCRFLGDRGVFDGSSEATLHPVSYWWFLVLYPAFVVAGALVLGSRRRLGLSVALAGFALAALVLLPTVYGAGFALYYLLPAVATAVAGLVALAAGRRRVAKVVLGCGAAATVLLVIPSFVV